MVRAATLGLAALLAWPGVAAAQIDSREGIALQNQILELRRDMQALQQQRPLAAPAPRGGGGGASSEITAQLLDRIQTLEDEVRRQRGQLDEAGNAQRRLADDLNKQIADLSFRLQNGGGASAVAPNPGQVLTPPPRSGDLPGRPGPDVPVRRTPELAMQEGNAALARRDYPAAEAAAREVIAGRPGPRTADGQFLLAQALAGQHDYRGAAVAYGDTYSRGRTGSHAPDALLGLASALSAINERESTCATLNQLRSEFPARADLREGETALRRRNGC